MIKIAVTGGLSCGKSSVSRLFSGLGAYVVSADDIVHNILRSPNTNVCQKVIALLGSDIIVDGQIDRANVAKKVFADPALLLSLEAILHPAVFDEINRQFLQQKAKESNNTLLFVAEVPLLFESGGQNYFDYTVAVIAPEEVCKSRFIQATGLSASDFDKRMARQISPIEKAGLADFTIENNGSQNDLQQSVANLYKKFLNPN